MRDLLLPLMFVVATIGCSGLNGGATHEMPGPGPDALDVADSGGDIPIADPASDESDTEIKPDADITDAPDVDVPPGTLQHFGWFGPGSVLTGTGISGFGSVSGPQQALQVK